MRKPDLSGVRELTTAELSELRARRNKQTKRKSMKEAKQLRFNKTVKLVTPRRKTGVASVSISPALKRRAEVEIGDGNFSRAVTIAIRTYLDALDSNQVEVVPRYAPNSLNKL